MVLILSHMCNTDVLWMSASGDSAQLNLGLYDHRVTDVGELEHQNPSSGEEPPPQPVEDLQTCMRSITSETRELLNEWQEPFR